MTQNPTTNTEARAVADVAAIAACHVVMLNVARRLVDQRGEPWPNGTESDRLHYWRDKAINAANALRQHLEQGATAGVVGGKEAAGG
ncbi:hypothetical protein O6V14_04810 [Sphingomonas faeni]|uniref:hypothetical protein n=1 Tax=Sphingomonas faeni TaxID=185950 RepID=UPI00334AB782